LQKQMKKHALKSWSTILCVAALVLSIFPLLPAPSANAADNPVARVDWNIEHQTMDGLGGSIAFNKAASMKRIYDMNAVAGRQLLDLYFSQDKGIGIEIVRVLLGDGGITNPATGAEWGNRDYDGPSDTIWPAEATGFVWDQPDWATKKAEFDKAQVWFMQEAMSYGVKTFYADAWSPPYWMKTNNSVLGAANAKLAPAHYQDYADYLVEYALGYKREFGIPITHIGPTNESEASHPSYSGFVISSAEYKDFIMNYLGPTLKKAIDDGKFAELNMDPPKIVGPEGTNLNASLSLGGATLTDPNSSQYIDVFSTHLYGTSNFNNGPVTSTGASGAYPDYLRNFRLWQTEFMTQNNSSSAASANTQIYRNQTITDGVKWANLFTNLFTSDPGFNAYLWWWPVGSNGADGSDLIRLATTGSPQGNGSTVTGEYRVFKRFYTFGNFSRFIKPGDIRIDSTRVPAAGLNISAYKNSETDDFSIIVVNSGATSQQVTFDLESFPAGASAIVGYRTSASENQKLLDPIVIQEGTFTATIPADTVTTFVPQTDHNLPGLTSKRDIFSTLEAEDNDGASGDFQAIPAGAGQALSGVSNGDYIKFANINFADGSANGGIVRRHILSMNAVVAPMKGGIIEARIDDPVTGRIVGSFTAAAGDGTQYSSIATQMDTGDNAAYGYHDLYLVFRGNGSDLFNIDRFEFGEVALPSSSLLTNGSFEAQPSTNWVRAYGNTGTTLTLTTGQNYSAPVTATNSTTANSLMVTNRAEAANGPSQVITSKLTAGQSYKVSGFFMPSTEGATGRISLVALDAVGNVVHTQTIAERSGMKAMNWSQVNATFIYEAPEVDFATMKVVFADSSTETMYLDEVALVPYVDKYELMDVLSAELDQGRYSGGAWATIADLRNDGWTLVGNQSATQSQVGAAVAGLRDAYGQVLSGAVLSGTDRAAAGDSFTLAWGLTGVTSNVFAEDLTITYDAGELELIAAPASTDESQFIVIDYLADTPGVLRMLGVHLGDWQTSPNQDLIHLSFRANANAQGGPTDVTVTNLAVADGEGVETELEGATHTIQVVVISKLALNAQIDEAQTALDQAVEGKLIGQYPAGSKALLQAAITQALVVANNPVATQVQIDAAAAQLDGALQAFTASVITKLPTDYNNDNRVSIGDLAVMAKSYGATSADAGWEQIKHLDLNEDGVIDIVDLARIARMIFEW